MFRERRLMVDLVRDSRGVCLGLFPAEKLGVDLGSYGFARCHELI